MTYQDRLSIPNVDDLTNRIHEEAHGYCYSIHLGSTKMHHDLRGVFWWNGLKKNIENFVAKCPNFQQVKDEHLKLSGLLQENKIPTWKWEDINMEFILGSPKTRSQHNSIWVVVERLTKSAHFIPIKSTYSAEDHEKIYIN